MMQMTPHAQHFSYNVHSHKNQEIVSRHLRTPISPADVAAAKAVPIAEVIGREVRLRGDFALCVFHAEKSPSLHVDRKRNLFHCFGCGAGGDTITWIERTQRVDFADAVRILLGIADSRAPQLLSSRNPTCGEEMANAARIRNLVKALWEGAVQPAIAEFYLESRGIRLRPKPLPWALRGHPRVWCSETKEYRPAMLAAISGETGAIVAVHRTWCDQRVVAENGHSPEKGARAQLHAPKKALGSMGSGAVRLGDAGPVIGLAEGVETALAAAFLYKLPVWATCGLSRWGSADRPPSVFIPPATRKLILFADNGAAGRTAANFACAWWRRRGLRTDIMFPGRQFDDWNDQLRNWAGV